MSTTEKYLIIGPAWVGDMVMAQTLFITLKQHSPKTIIDVLAPDWSRPLLERMPEVRQTLSLPIGHGQLHVRKRYQIGRALRQAGYDQAIVLPNSFKSALIPFFAQVPKRTGWVGEFRYGLLNDARVLDHKKFPLMIQRFAHLAFPKNSETPTQIPYPKLQISTENLKQTLQKFEISLTDKQPILALCPGAEFGSSKRWPAHYYAEVANTMLNQGWQVWLFGSPNDQPQAEIIQQQTDNRCINWVGRTTLASAIDLLSLATGVISNDSGLMHIAAALGRPLVSIYGSTSPTFTPPLTQQVSILKLELPCSPCFKRECPLTHLRCLHDLKPDQVVQAFKQCVQL